MPQEKKIDAPVFETGYSDFPDVPALILDISVLQVLAVNATVQHSSVP